MSDPMEQEDTEKKPRSERRRLGTSLAVRVSDADAEAIQAAADAAGMTRGDYIRAAILGRRAVRRTKRPDRAELAQMVGHLGKIGSNLNQIARHANVTYKSDGLAELPPADELHQVAAEVRDLQEQIMRVLGVDYFSD